MPPLYTTMKSTASIVAVALAAFAFVLKLANPSLPENVWAFGGLALFCGYALRGYAAWAFPLAVFIAADIVGHLIDDVSLGVYHPLSMLLNYAGLAAMCGVGAAMRRQTNWLVICGGCLCGSAAFFLLSNFGAWLDPQMGYQRTLGDLARCYAMGLPFVRGTVAGDLLFGSASILGYRWYLGLAAAPAVESVESAKG